MEKARKDEILAQDRAFVRLFPVCLVISTFFLLAFIGLGRVKELIFVLEDLRIFFLSDVFLAFGLDAYMWIIDERKSKKREGRF